MDKVGLATDILNKQLYTELPIRTRSGRLSHVVTSEHALLYLRSKIADPVFSGNKQQIRFLRLRIEYAAALSIIKNLYDSGKSGFVGEDSRTFYRCGKSYELHFPHCYAFDPSVRNL